MYVIMHKTILFILLTNPFQYHYPDKIAKKLGTKLNLCKTHCATYKTVFGCDVLKNGF